MARASQKQKGPAVKTKTAKTGRQRRNSMKRGAYRDEALKKLNPDRYPFSRELSMADVYVYASPNSKPSSKPGRRSRPSSR